ncbi:MAG: peptide chain release factor-like protein [Phycisphaerae bacterium]|nr:peptide chain release factor-like protein [Phycisphaerae bacterium]
MKILSPHPAALPIDELLKQCQVTTGRTSGPGGQHRNKVETAVTIEHTPTDINGSAGERRSQAHNRAMALFRLRVNLAVQVRCTVVMPYQPTDLWRSRCNKAGRVRVGPEHDDLPAMLAEAIDVIAACEYDVKAAAEQLACTPTQLIKLIVRKHTAIGIINNARMERGMHPLRRV